MIIDATSLVTNPQGNRPMDPARVIGMAVHHTVGNNAVQSEADERATIRAIDAQHENMDFGGFGYHYIVFPSGRAYKCGEGQRAHVAKRNHELRGVAMSGTFTTEQPTEAALNGLREVLRTEAFIAPVVKGHREWALPGEATACPGVIVPRDWAAFMEPPTPPAPPMPDGWVAVHNQLLAVNGREVVLAIGDWEGKFPGQIAKLFGNQWWWLRKGADGSAYWSEERGD